MSLSIVAYHMTISAWVSTAGHFAVGIRNLPAGFRTAVLVRLVMNAAETVFSIPARVETEIVEHGPKCEPFGCQPLYEL